MTLFLARHGSTTAEGLFLGSSDPPLSEKGRRESGELAKGLANRGVERVVSSGLRRAAETAGIIADRLELAVETDPRFNEIGYGDWDGLAWAEIERRWPQEARSKLENWWGVTPPAGEPGEAFFARLRTGVADLRAENRPTVLVAHLAVNGLICEWAGDRSDALLFEQDCGTTIEISIG